MPETVECPMNALKETFSNWWHEPEWIQNVADLGAQCKWDELLNYLNKEKGMINMSRLSSKGESPPSLFTPLHYAADGKAPKQTFEALLEMGSSKCLKTSEGETAYDIGKRKGLDLAILELLKIPEEVVQNKLQIQAMEASLHAVINGRVGELVTKHGLQLPQLDTLYEVYKYKVFYFDIVGWHGGFRVYEHEKGIQVDSFCRIWGGSEQNHLIERDGKVTLLPNDNPV